MKKLTKRGKELPQSHTYRTEPEFVPHLGSKGHMITASTTLFFLKAAEQVDYPWEEQNAKHYLIGSKPSLQKTLETFSNFPRSLQPEASPRL
jgi:hypothetical protein